MTLKNNRPPLLCYFKLCASFHSHWWIQTGVTVRKRPISVKIDNFFSRVTLLFDWWPWKTIGHLFYATSSFVHHFVTIGEFKLELQSGNTQFGSNSTIFEPCDLEIWQMTLKNNRAPLHHQALCIIPSPYVNWNWSYGPEMAQCGHDLCDLDLWPLALTFCMDVISVNGNKSWKFQDDTMTGTLSKRCDGRKAVQHQIWIKYNWYKTNS